MSGGKGQIGGAFDPKKGKRGPSRWVWLVLAGVILLPIVSLGGLYVIKGPHPGYASLERTLDELKLPEGWSEVGPRAGEKDNFLGLCRDLAINCPSLGTNYSFEGFGLDAKAIMNEFLQVNDFVIAAESEICEFTANQTPEEFICFIEAKKGEQKARLSQNESGGYRLFVE